MILVNIEVIILLPHRVDIFQLLSLQMHLLLEPVINTCE